MGNILDVNSGTALQNSYKCCFHLCMTLHLPWHSRKSDSCFYFCKATSVGVFSIFSCVGKAYNGK